MEEFQVQPAKAANPELSLAQRASNAITHPAHKPGIDRFPQAQPHKGSGTFAVTNLSSPQDFSLQNEKMASKLQQMREKISTV